MNDSRSIVVQTFHRSADVPSSAFGCSGLGLGSRGTLDAGLCHGRIAAWPAVPEIRNTEAGRGRRIADLLLICRCGPVPPGVPSSTRASTSKSSNWVLHPRSGHCCRPGAYGDRHAGGGVAKRRNGWAATDRGRQHQQARPKFYYIASLKGARIAFLNQTEGTFIQVREMLQRHGLHYPADYSVEETGGVPARHKALLSRTIDAGLQSAL